MLWKPIVVNLELTQTRVAFVDWFHFQYGFAMTVCMIHVSLIATLHVYIPIITIALCNLQLSKCVYWYPFTFRVQSLMYIFLFNMHPAIHNKLGTAASYIPLTLSHCSDSVHPATTI